MDRNELKAGLAADVGRLQDGLEGNACYRETICRVSRRMCGEVSGTVSDLMSDRPILMIAGAWLTGGVLGRTIARRR